MPQVDEHLARRLTIALLSFPSNSVAARALDIGGFTIPADYGSVENLLRRLRMPPFDYAPTFTLTDLWRKYESWITLLGVLGLLLAGLIAILIRQNRRVRQIMRYNRSQFSTHWPLLAKTGKS